MHQRLDPWRARWKRRRSPPDLGDQAECLAALGVHGVVIRDGVVAPEGADAGPDGVHRRTVGGQFDEGGR